MTREDILWIKNACYSSSCYLCIIPEAHTPLKKDSMSVYRDSVMNQIEYLNEAMGVKLPADSS